MGHGGRLVSWAAMALAVPAVVAFSPVHPAESFRWEPQVVSAAQHVHSGVRAGLATIPRPGAGKGAIAVKAALTRLGDPYVWAAAGPHAFDCSGLVVWAFQQAGLDLPHSSQSLAAGGRPVSLDRLQPGDVVTYYSGASHVALYVGGGRVVHASTEGVPVAVTAMDHAPIYNVRRYG